MSVEFEKDYFKYSYNEPSSYGFHALSQNFFVEEVLAKRSDKKSTQLYFRLLRTGILGDVLYKAGELSLESEEHNASNEILAVMFEAYLTHARSIYDYLLVFLREKYGVKETSFSRFLKRVKDGQYKGLNTKFRKHLDNKLFSDLRNLRDSVVHRTPNLMVYVKGRKFWVDGTLYRDDGSKEEFDESLLKLMFGYTSSLLLLMSYIAEAETGQSLSAQLKWYKEKENSYGQ